MKILLVDDEGPLREVIRATLEQLGYTVVEARDGREALQLHAAAPADLVVTDLYMPEKEGIEIIRELRKSSASLPILAISGGALRPGLATDELLEMARRMGANEVLAKPFTATQLEEAVAKLM